MFVPIVVMMCAVWLMGCDNLSTAVGDLGIRKVEARTADDKMEAFLTYQEALLGKDSQAVVEVFGEPKGIFEKQTGKVWMYARWCVRFDGQGRVVGVERDIAVSGSGGASNGTSMALAAKPITPVETSSGMSQGVIKISKGGQLLDLNSLMPPGKIIVVDFYADWCGPCRKISPHLEKLAGENPDVVLVKVDIVKWGTPVAQQYNIHSVPNLRVFNRSRKLVGQPTASLSAVQSYIHQAGG